MKKAKIHAKNEIFENNNKPKMSDNSKISQIFELLEGNFG